MARGELIEKKKRIDRLSYLAGFFSAIFLLAIIFTGSLLLLSTRGIAVYLDSEEVARMVREQVIVQAKHDLPKLIAGAKAEVPKIVEEEMRDQLTSDRMEIAGFVFRVPDELLNQLKSNMQDNVENATSQILDGIDTEIVAEQFGEDVYRMVRDTMHTELGGQTFDILAFDRIPVKVRVIVR